MSVTTTNDFVCSKCGIKYPPFDRANPGVTPAVCNDCAFTV